MSKSSNPHEPRRFETSSADTLDTESPWAPTSNAFRQVLHGMASLRLTVALLAMAIFIVLAGTLGQVHRDIWDVIHDYFRMNVSDESGILGTIPLFGREFNIPTPVTWIDLKIFFPPSFFENQQIPDLSTIWSPARLFTSLLLGMGVASLVWLVPLKDKKFQLGIFASLGLMLTIMMGVGATRTYDIMGHDGKGQLDINLDVASVRTFAVTIEGETSAAISHDAEISEIQAAIDEIAGVTAGDFTVTKPRAKTVQVKANPAGSFGNESVAMSAKITAKPAGFWFPKGWTIGAVMAINLLAAHLIRFKIQSKGARLWAGVGVIGLGILATYAVIQSGSNKYGVLKENLLGGMELDWSTIWVIFEFALALLLVFGIYGYISLWRRTLRNPDLTQQERSATVITRRIAGFSNLALAGLLIYLVQGGDQTQLNESGMRILWQLLKATVAGLILLAGCVLVFRKRAGVVVLHSGVALVMLSELLVGVSAVESQMTIMEGQSSNYAQDIREVEIAVTDPSDPETDRVVVIPKRFLKEETLIQDERLPFNIRVDAHYKNSFLEKPTPTDENPATEGAGLVRIARPAQASTGTDMSNNVDFAAAYVTLFTKTSDGENDRELGTWLISQHLNPQPVEVDDETYEIELRFKRYYKPYTLTLVDAQRKDYVGTGTPRDFRSIVNLKDDTRQEDRKGINIWMNNPLRYGGETFYQSGMDNETEDEDGRPDPKWTVLQIVSNDGWMIPYVACMIVWVGMMAHFLIGLTRFLNRERPVLAKASGIGQTAATATALDDPLHERSKRAWLTPTLAGVLILFFGGYLASKAVPPQETKEGFDFYKAGQIPVAYKGRVKPMDTLARSSLRIMSNKQQFTDTSGEKQLAMRWLLDLIVDPDKAAKHPVIRIDNMEVLGTLGLTNRKSHLYSYEEIIQKKDDPKVPFTDETVEFLQTVQTAMEKSRHKQPMTTYQKKSLEVYRRMQVYEAVGDAFTHSLADGKDAMGDLLAAIEKHKQLENKSSDPPLLSSQVTEKWETFNKISLRTQILKLAESLDAESTHELAQNLIEEFEAPLAALAVAELRGEVERKAKASPRTFADTAKALAQSESDENRKQVYEIISEARPRDKDLELAQRLPKDVIKALAQEQAPYYLVRQTGAGAQLLGMLQEKAPGTDTNKAMLVLGRMLEGSVDVILENKPLDEFASEAPFEEIFQAYKNGDAEKFNSTVDTYLASLEEQPVYDHDKLVTTTIIEFESFFNNAAPFFHLAAVYLIAGLLAAVSWLMSSRPLNRATFYLLCFALMVHTAALIGRIYISGRPPVTNLYSSALFIGWGCVLLGLLFEWFYDIGLGNLVAAVAGFMTLGVAHLLTTGVANFRGDDLEVMQAVLDTQFWLATHVVCISLGYATTFVAGFLGIAYILGGAFTPLLTSPRRKDLVRMIYATLCFAIFFSFVGTVLGGLWADDSWGRFWGWDTKENGALIIVLWNALVLHARWGGIVKEKGLALLAVAGNIAVSWSWFGVNELGIGLHSYGVTEGVMFLLSLFWVSQILILAIGSLPKNVWWSHIAEDTQAHA